MKNRFSHTLLVAGLAITLSACAPTVTVVQSTAQATPQGTTTPTEEVTPAQTSASAEPTPTQTTQNQPSPESPTEGPSAGTYTDAQLAGFFKGVADSSKGFSPAEAVRVRQSMVSAARAGTTNARVQPAECGVLMNGFNAAVKGEKAAAALQETPMAGTSSMGSSGLKAIQLMAPSVQNADVLKMPSADQLREVATKCADMTVTTGKTTSKSHTSMVPGPKVSGGYASRNEMQMEGRTVVVVVSGAVVKGVIISATAFGEAGTTADELNTIVEGIAANIG